MLNVTSNETEVVQKALQGEYDSKNIVTTLNLLLKYYYIGGMNDRLKLREQLLNFLKHNYEGYKRAKWEDTIIKIVNRFLKVVRENKLEVKMIDINEIKISKAELDSISSLNDIKLEKLAFIMLIYAKISNITMNSSEGWINKSCATICKEAKVNLKGTEKEKIFNELYKVKYIEQRLHNAKTNIRVCYIQEDSPVELVVNDFDGVIYQYLMWKGEKWKKCEECSKWIRIKGDKPPKYCKSCKDIKQLEWQRNSMKKLRSRDCEVLLE